MDGRTIFEQSKRGQGKQQLSSNDVTLATEAERGRDKASTFWVRDKMRVWAQVQGDSEIGPMHHKKEEGENTIQS